MLPVRFAVLMPTHAREALAIRALESIRAQSYPEWKLVCVNDSPEIPYGDFERSVAEDKRITYIRNTENEGKNASLNAALAHLRNSGFKGYIILLDDDDWLDSDCLEQFARTLSERPYGWLVSDRVLSSGTRLTKNRTGCSEVSYYREYLITKRFSGDATHCINSVHALACVFPSSAKNGEEWFFFSQIARACPRFTYLPFPGTYSEGYLPGGVTHERASFRSRLGLYARLTREIGSRNLWNLALFVYMALRFGRMCIPKRASVPVSR